MTSWLKISLMLCFFGFLKEIRPSEPFVTDFLTIPWRNITLEELNRYVYPIGIYCGIAEVIIILLITDLLRYKPVVVAIGVLGIINYALNLWTTSMFWTQIIQVVFSAYIACEVAYFTYIYAKVSKEHYQAVSSHTRAALLLGRCVSGLIGQSLVYTELMDIRELNFITLGTQIAATAVAVMLPSVETSIYFHRADSMNSIVSQSKSIEEVNRPSKHRFKSALDVIASHLRIAYTNQHVVLWSICYAFATCGFLQVEYYSQVVWIAIDNDPANIWNGLFASLVALLSAGTAMLASRVHVDMFKTTNTLLALLIASSACLGGSIVLLANTNSRYWAYTGNAIFYMIYTFVITIASAEIAKYLPDDSFGLIFGLNSFFAICISSIITIVVISDIFSFELSIFDQFNVYAGFFGVLSASYLLLLLIRLYRNRSTDATKCEPNELAKDGDTEVCKY